MLTSKERAFLRGLAGKLEPLIHVGKNGITDTLIQQVEETFTSRELIKGKVLENAPVTAREACDALAKGVRGEPVQVIGSKFVLYRENRDMPPDQRIRLPKAKK